MILLQQIKKLYDEIKQYNENPIQPNYYNDEINENKVEIYLVDDIFIYKINENVLGIGIPEIQENTGFPIFKIEFLIIINKNYINEEKILNSDSEINEIFKSKDLETYLIINRKVRFEKQDNLKKIDMKFFNGDKIGIIYNINDFKIENYWRRTKEKYVNRMKLKESYQESESERRKKEDEKCKKKEQKENLMFKDTLDKKNKKMEKEYEYDLKRFKIWDKNDNCDIYTNTIRQNPIKVNTAIENDVNRNVRNNRYNDLNDNATSNDNKSVKTCESNDKYSIFPNINGRRRTFRSILESGYGSIKGEGKSPFILAKSNNLLKSINISRKSSNEFNKNIPNLCISCSNFYKSIDILPKLTKRNTQKYNEKEEERKEEDKKEEKNKEEDQKDEDKKEEDQKDEGKKEKDKKDKKKIKINKKKHKNSLLTKEQEKKLKELEKKHKEKEERKKRQEEEKKKIEDKKRIKNEKKYNKVIKRGKKIFLQDEKFKKEEFKIKHPDINLH